MSECPLNKKFGVEKHLGGSGGGEGENVHDLLPESQCHRLIDGLYPTLGTVP